MSNVRSDPETSPRKLEAAKLPVTVILDDTDAMIPGRDLSSADGPVNIVARLSQSGNAAAQPGDIEGVRTVIVKPGIQELDIALNQIVGSTAPEEAAAPSPGS